MVASELRDKIMVDAGNRLTSVIAQILSKVERSKVLVIGGGDELTLPALKGASDGLEGDFGAIILDPSLDVKPRFQRQIDEAEPTFHETNHSHLRSLFADEVEIDRLNQIVFFGVQGHRVAQEEVNFISQSKRIQSQIVYTSKDIRKPRIDPADLFRGFQQNQVVALDLSSVKSHFAPGVGSPCPSMGFTDDEISEIAFIAGQSAHQRLFTISEYNPAIEKFTTGTLLHNIL